MIHRRALGPLCGLLLSHASAHAQYRNNGLSAEVGVEAHEGAPFTLALLGGSTALVEGWDLLHRQGHLPRRPTAVEGCWTRFRRGAGGLPCRNPWWDLTDGPYFGVGFQRVVGDLLVDVTETPLLKSLVLTGRSGFSPAMTLPFGPGFLRPAGLLHGELGLRWNILDEAWRPFIGASLVMSALLDPVGVITRTLGMKDTCRRADAGEPLGPDEVCVRDGGTQVPGTPVEANPTQALFGLNAAPVFVGVRPEAGLEWFFLEDISLQLAVSAAAHVSPLPRYFMTAPFLGVSARGTAAVVAYF